MHDASGSSVTGHAAPLARAPATTSAASYGVKVTVVELAAAASRAIKNAARSAAARASFNTVAMSSSDDDDETLIRRIGLGN